MGTYMPVLALVLALVSSSSSLISGVCSSVVGVYAMIAELHHSRGMGTSGAHELDSMNGYCADGWADDGSDVVLFTSSMKTIHGVLPTRSSS